MGDVELVELVNEMRIVELSAKTRLSAIRALAQALKLANEEILLDDLLEAIEEREAVAQTIIDEGFAIPHADIDWDGDFRIVLGRSRAGVDYGIADAPLVHLIVLFVVGRTTKKHLHLDVLAALAELMGTPEFRQRIVEAPDTPSIKQLLQSHVGLAVERQPRVCSRVPRVNTILVRQAVQVANDLSAQALLVAVDKLENGPWDALEKWAGRLLVVSTLAGEDFPIKRPDTYLFDVPHSTLTRVDRTKLGILLAASDGLLSGNADVVCVTGHDDGRLDAISLSKPDSRLLEAMFSGKSGNRSVNIRPAVILRALSLAIELASEGREGKAVGAMFVIGDLRQVLRHTQQLVLNPFHGYSRSLRSLLDMSLAETIKEFAQVDGAFIISADGMVHSAGTYLVPKTTSAELPSGLGTRHQAAAAITSHTKSTAIVVSQSTGTVTVFRHGQIVLQLERANITHT